jgi:hypothetical protein
MEAPATAAFLTMAGAMAMEVPGREGALDGYPAQPTGLGVGMDRGRYALSAAGIPAAAAGVTGMIMTMGRAGRRSGLSRVQQVAAVPAGIPGSIVSRAPKRTNRKGGTRRNGLRTEATSSPGIPGRPAEGVPFKAPRSASRVATGTAAVSVPAEAVSGPEAAAAAGRTDRSPGPDISRGDLQRASSPLKNRARQRIRSPRWFWMSGCAVGLVTGTPAGGGPYSSRLRCAAVEGLDLLLCCASPCGRIPRRATSPGYSTGS